MSCFEAFSLLSGYYLGWANRRWILQHIEAFEHDTVTRNDDPLLLVLAPFTTFLR